MLAKRDRRDSGRDLFRFWGEAWDRNEAEREILPQDLRFIDVEYEEIRDDAISVAKRIYAVAGRSLVGGPTREFGPDSYGIWSTKGANLVPDTTDAEAPASVGYFPLPGETAFKFVSITPQVGEDSEQVDVPAEVLNEVFEADNPGMHTSDTIDYLYIVSGQADLELDEGRKERVGAGDCVVQRGTRHAWRVIGSEPLVMCAVLLGAERIHTASAARRQPIYEACFQNNRQ